VVDAREEGSKQQAAGGDWSSASSEIKTHDRSEVPIYTLKSKIVKKPETSKSRYVYRGILSSSDDGEMIWANNKRRRIVNMRQTRLMRTEQ